MDNILANLEVLDRRLFKISIKDVKNYDSALFNNKEGFKSKRISISGTGNGKQRKGHETGRGDQKGRALNHWELIEIEGKITRTEIRIARGKTVAATFVAKWVTLQGNVDSNDQKEMLQSLSRGRVTTKKSGISKRSMG